MRSRMHRRRGVTPVAMTPRAIPSITKKTSPDIDAGATLPISKTGRGPASSNRSPAAVALAMATGMIERARNSKSNSSIASRTAATGQPNVAVMPAAAPAAKSVFRSAGVVEISCPKREPNAPPVAMTGPSAPNGPPVPMEIAADSGFRNVNRAGILL